MDKQNNEMDVKEYIQATKKFKTEEDVRVETNNFLEKICNRIGVKLNIKGHEVTSVFGGRADSIYSDVIIEYKAIDVDITKAKGFNEVVYGRDEKDHGLYDYLINFSLEKAHNDSEFVAILKDKIGVGINGKAFIFTRFVDSESPRDIYNNKKTKGFPENISHTQKVTLKTEIIDDVELGFKKLLLYLKSTTRRRLNSESILCLFGPDSENCTYAINSLYSCLKSNIVDNNLRVITLYNEWNRIFGDVYGDKETNFTSIRQSLSEKYTLKFENNEIQYVLFTIQTYYNIILKLLVYKFLECIQEPTTKHTKRLEKILDVYQLFTGKLFAGSFHIQNFFEVQFFEWFLYANNFDLTIIQNSLLKLDTLEVTASIIKPEIVEDVFREVYNGLMPKTVRHLLGEYYTPGWLVDFVLDKAGYYGDADKTLLDPTCGSGSFITHAIKRYFENNEAHTKEDIINNVKNISTHIVGYDINPISVITAKTNYILSLGDLSLIDEDINIPIYMCDSILVPTVHAKQNSLSHSIKIKTVVGEFEVPVFETRTDSDRFMQEVSTHVEQYSFDEFMQYLKHKGVIFPKNFNIDIAHSFYEKIAELHLTSQDGFWGIILKNAFAPLFAKGGFDVVVGNPPWIAWKAMSDTYRVQTLDIWLSYGIFEKNAYDKITTHDDFAMAVTYVSLDHYCKKNGELVFILPQTFLKASKGGEGFRKFCITRDGLSIPFSVEEVYDMQQLHPFKGIASNRPAVIKFRKDKKMQYPMSNYWECLPVIGDIKYGASYHQAMNNIRYRQLVAKPINALDERSPWLTLDATDMLDLEKYRGISPYDGRKGIEPCGAKGIYLINILGPGKNGSIIIKNIIERSRLPAAKLLGEHIGEVEKDFVYPMVGGRNFEKWGLKNNIYMLVPHYSTGDGVYRGVAETDLKIHYPKTYEWLLYFHDLLLETRIRSGKFYDPKQFPFYRLDNVGPYTFKPYHVIWKEQSKKMVACVISTLDSNILGNKIIVTDSKVLSVSFDNENEAHYLCAIINSKTITKIIESYTIDTQRGIDILKNIAIPKFDNNNESHSKLVELSHQAHEAHNTSKTTEDIEDAIDKLIPIIFNKST